MSFWNRLRWFLSYKGKVVNPKVIFTLHTDSGYPLIQITEKLEERKGEKVIRYISYSKYDILGYLETRDKLEKEFKFICNLRAQELLKEYQDIDFKELKTGFVKTGKHIVDCLWNITFDTEKLTYEEYLDY